MFVKGARLENIEAEIRSFISKDKYFELIDFFDTNAIKVKDDFQETHYFDCKEDVRIQKNNNNYSKIWMKKGKIHDEAREEMEIKVEKEDFPKLEKLFETLGNEVKIKWFRKRKEYDWQGIKVDLDYTKGYGYIIELEKMSDSKNKEKTLRDLKEKFIELGIDLTSREIFEEKFKNYEINWKTLIEQDSFEQV
jgi:predicted adenylyl cyclase CyaB